MRKSLPVLAALCASTLALAACDRTGDGAFGEKVRAYLLEHPEVIEEAVQKLGEKREIEAAQAATSAIETHRAALEQDPRDFVANPNGTVTVTEFFDYRCGYCKIAATEMSSIIEENPDVRVVFKEFPIFGEQSDETAAIMLTDLAKPKTLELHERLMAEKSLDDAALDRHLRAVGIDPAAARKAAQAPAIQQQLVDTHELAASLGINGTPAFVIGDRLISGADMEAVKAAITSAQAEKIAG
ncbi:MAG: disulfide bond formation protein DsbA [Phenylobacterium sp.]|jgi:protein-disulfide isomerase|nr:disulfide bond formation protein DsbA [Phenylobacterium sp.]|tara:strand:- start:60362 stop:61087 length:726 start_codon:yes stop_codon:yes gene_type:complete